MNYQTKNRIQNIQRGTASRNHVCGGERPFLGVCGALFASSIMFFVFGFIHTTSAAPNYEMNYQGKLTNASNVAVADDTYNMRFWILTSPTIATTSALWTEELTGSDAVQVSNGLFSIMLGSTTPLTGIDWNQTLYLGVEIGGTSTPAWDGEMSPRKILGTVPSAFEAENAQTLGGIATTSFLRSDEGDTASGLLTFTGGFVSTASSTIAGLTTDIATTTTLVTTYININGTTFDSLLGSGLTLSSNDLTCRTASNVQFGCLTATDWTIFNGKISSTSLDTSAELAALLDDETGTGSVVFSTNPLLNGFRSFASSTIGDGTGAGGLTVLGNSTTTGMMVIGDNSGSGRLTILNSSRAYLNLNDTGGVDDSAWIVFQSGGVERSHISGGYDNRQKPSVVFNVAGSSADFNSATWMRETTNDTRFGIGTTSPSARLHVVANDTVTSVPTLFVGPVGGVPYLYVGSYNQLGNVGIGTSSPSAKLSIHANVGDTNPLLFTIASSTASGATTSLFVIDNQGNVGVGFDPSTIWKLNVNGNVAARGFSDADNGGYFVNPYSTSGHSGSFNRAISIGTSSPYLNTLLTVAGDAIVANMTATGTLAVSGNTTLAHATSTSLYTNTLGLGTDYITDITGSGLLLTDGVLSATGDGLSNWLTVNGALTPSTTLGIRINASSTIGDGTGAGGLTVLGNSTTTGSAYFGGNMGIGTANPTNLLHVYNNSGSNSASVLIQNGSGSGGAEAYLRVQTAGANADAYTQYYASGVGYWVTGFDTNSNRFVISASNNLVSNPETSKFYVTPTGAVGVGTSSPSAKLTIEQGMTGTGNLFQIASSSNGTATTTHFVVDQFGNVGIGTSSPVSLLSVAGLTTATNFYAYDTNATTTLAGGLNVGAGGLVYDFSTGETYVGSLISGAQTFDDDAGIVQWTDLPVYSASLDTVESYTASIGGNEMLTIYGLSTGASTTYNNRVGIGTSTPSRFFTVAGDAYFTNNITSASSTLGYASSSALTATNGYFTNSSLGYASSTALTVSGLATLGNISATNATTSGALVVNGTAKLMNEVVIQGRTLSSGFDATPFLYADEMLFFGNGSTLLGVGALANVWNTGTYSYNTAVGMLGLGALVVGNNNTSVGSFAFSNMATGTGNVAFGYSAGSSQTEGDNNIVIGNSIDLASTTGSNQLNIGNLLYGTGLGSEGRLGIGTSSPRSTLTIQGSGTTNPFAIASSTGDNLFSISSSGILNIRSGTSTQASTTNIFVNGGSATTTVLRNIALGFDSLTNITAGANDNIAFGYQALLGSSTAKMTGYGNFAAGRQALYSNTTGSFNNALGLSALYSNTTGKYNNAFGADSTTAGGSLSNNTTGSFNNALGGSTLAQNTTGSNNNAFGNGALINNTTGSNNNALGSYAGGNLGYIATSSGNIFLGAFAGQNQAQGDNNIFIGYDSQVASTTGSNQLSIGNLIYGLNTATGANVATGTVGIGTTSPRSTLTIQGSGTTNLFTIASSSGSSMLTVLANGNVGIGTTSPSAKLSIHANNGETNQYLLNIASSTASATSSLFSVLNNGYVYIGSAGFRDGGGGQLMVIRSSDNSTGSLRVGPIYTNGIYSDSTGASLKLGGSSISDTTQTDAVLAGYGTYSQTSTPTADFAAFRIYPTYNQSGSTASNTDLSILRKETAIGSGAQYLINAQTGGALNAWATSTKFSVDRTGLGYFAGKLGIGTTTPVSLLTMGTTSVTTSGVAGLKQYFSFMNPTASSIQYGDETYIVNAPTATSTLVGKMIRIEDTSTLGNTVRGLEAQAFRGTNTKGENTGLSGYGRTFGVRGTTLGDAGSVYVPAGVFAESQGTTQGNALRAYSGTITSEDLVSLFHDGSAFSGTGLSMNFGNSGGSFAATSSAKFIDFQVGGTSKFTITGAGTTTIGDGTTANMAGLQIGFGGLCVDNDGSCTASTTGRITSVSSASGNSDLAEMYFSSDALESGEIVSLVGGLSVGRAQGADSDETIIGVVSTKPGLIMGFDDTSLSAGETAYPIALKGRVPIKLSTENGPIMKGDRIALSSIPGVGMKAEDGDTVVGIALEDYSGEYAYSPAYLNQFGSDLVKAKMQARSQETDPRTQDGCSYGGGNAQGEAPCVKDKVAPIKPVTVSVDTKTSAMNALKTQSAEIRETEGGQEVTIGQAIMFVHLHDFIAEGSRDVLAELSATSSVQNGNGTETLWDRVKALAQNFVDGVLRVTGIKTEELCVGNVCVDEATFLRMVEQAGGVQSSGGTSTESGATGGGTDTTDNSGTVTPPPEEPTPTIEEPTSTTESPVEEPPLESTDSMNPDSNGASNQIELISPEEPAPTPEPPII